MAKWTKANVNKLIKLRGVVFKSHFKTRSTHNQVAWEHIKSMLPDEYDVKLISKKWSNLVQKYKTLRDLSSGQSTEDGTNTVATWPYYEAMEEVFQSGLNTPLTSISSPSFAPAASSSLSASAASLPPASSLLPPGSSPLPPASPAASIEPHSPQFQPCYCGEKNAPKREKKQKRYSYMKILLQQNNKLIRLLNQLVVLAGGEGLTGEVEVPLDVD